VDGIGPIDGDGELLRLGDLAMGRAHRGPDVPDDIPGLAQNEAPALVIAQADIDGACRVLRARRQLEAQRDPVPSREPQDELLEREVASVRRLRGGVSPERQLERQVEGDADALPGIDRHASAPAELRLADPRSSQADPCPEPSLCEVAPEPRLADLSAKPGEEFLVAPAGFGR
jgi:hypothetical protein